MVVLEQFLQAKRDAIDTCEDGCLVKSKLIAVIDGVTAKGTHLWNGKTSGRFAMQVIIDFLQNDVEEQNPIELFSNLSSLLSSYYRQEFQSDILEEKLRANVIVYNDYYKEIWNYGDCQCMIDDVPYTHYKKIDKIISQKRANILKVALEHGKTPDELRLNDIGRLAIENDLKLQLRYENQNVPLGYPVINGDPIQPRMLRIYSVPSRTKVVLASDGYPILRNTLVQSETELKRLAIQDPMCIYENISTKGFVLGANSFDDRCYCSFFTD